MHPRRVLVIPRFIELMCPTPFPHRGYGPSVPNVADIHSEYINPHPHCRQSYSKSELVPKCEIHRTIRYVQYNHVIQLPAAITLKDAQSWPP